MEFSRLLFAFVWRGELSGPCFEQGSCSSLRVDDCCFKFFFSSWFALEFPTNWLCPKIEPLSKITIHSCSKWSIAKDVRPFSRRCNARHRQTFYDLVKVYAFDTGNICVHGRRFAFRQKYRKRSHFEADVRHMWKVDIGTIRWDFWSVSNQLGKFSM